MLFRSKETEDYKEVKETMNKEETQETIASDILGRKVTFADNPLLKAVFKKVYENYEVGSPEFSEKLATLLEHYNKVSAELRDANQALTEVKASSLSKDSTFDDWAAHKQLIDRAVETCTIFLDEVEGTDEDLKGELLNKQQYQW